MTIHTHAERKTLPYRADQIYNLVADIERYPEFLPWCVGLRVLRREANRIEAELAIGFRFVRERFTSRVTLSPYERIDVEYLDGPFKYLRNHWVFVPRDDGCEIDFYVEFQFRSRVLSRLLEPLFGEAVRRMVNAFEARARKLYGEPHGEPASQRAG